MFASHYIIENISQNKPVICMTIGFIVRHPLLVQKIYFAVNRLDVYSRFAFVKRLVVCSRLVTLVVPLDVAIPLH